MKFHPTTTTHAADAQDDRRPSKRGIWQVIRLLWVTAGLIFLLWLTRSYQAQGFAFEQLYLTPSILINEDDQAIEVFPINHSHAVGLLFYPGGMVDPQAYLPMAHDLAMQGYPVVIVKLPYRLAPLAEQEAAVHTYTRQTMTGSIIQKWALAGHSRGAAIAARFARHFPDAADALVLVGTTHPKEEAWSLARLTIPVTKIYGTQDGIADPETILANRALLPPQTDFVAIEGGNHSQFGYYGSQLGDGRATISRANQRKMLVAAIAAVLERLRTE